MGGRLVVVGDALLDVDLVGHAGRLSPDAPVPVLDELRELRRPGGAALAAALAAGDGAEVALVTSLAEDVEAAALEGLLAEHGVDLLVARHPGVTTVKRRVRAGGQSLLRLDTDGYTPPDLDVTAEMTAAIGEAQVILVSDYGRGATSAHGLRTALEAAATRVPIVWDPHPRGSRPVRRSRLVTPNHAEAAAFAAEEGQGATGAGLAAISDQAAALVRAWDAHAVVVTMGERGALVSRGESSPSVVPARRVVDRDTCGAGDRFASRAATAIADGAVVLEAVQSAVEAAADFVSAGGAAAIGLDPDSHAHGRPPAGPPGQGPWQPQPTGSDVVARVRARGGTVVATGGCFDILHAGHVATLEAARGLGDCLVVCLNSDASVRGLKGDGRPLVPQQDRARVLGALESVDQVVVFDEETPEAVLRRLRPDIWVKGGDYAGAELPEAGLLRSWGGQSVVVPYLDGRSTTALVTTAARSGQ